MLGSCSGFAFIYATYWSSLFVRPCPFRLRDLVAGRPSPFVDIVPSQSMGCDDPVSVRRGVWDRFSPPGTVGSEFDFHAN